MNKNTVKKLSHNPHYTMSEKELEALADMLADEAKSEKKQERAVPKINKNRVKKTFVKLDKVPALEEVDDNGDSK